MVKQPPAWKHWALRLFRAGILVAAVGALRLAGGDLSYDSAITLEQAQRHFPKAVELKQENDVQWAYGPQGERLGYVAKTLPLAKDVIGYAGPTDMLIAFDRDGVVTGISLLYSGDTKEHVEEIVEEQPFFESFVGWKLAKRNDAEHIDGVAGATLTSYAIIEAVSMRLSGDRPSLKFSEPVAIEDVQRLFPDAVRLQDKQVIDADGNVLGTVLRSAPDTDDIVGYQGPSDALIGLDREDKVVGITVGHSYEGQRYAENVRDSDFYRERHKGKTLQELADFDLDKLYADAVSGASLTSMSVGEAAIMRARIELEKRGSTTAQATAIPLDMRDVLTFIAIIVACFVAFTHTRAKRYVRLALQVYIIAVVGLWLGDLLSLALFGGWATGAVPWKSAPGLVALVAAAFVLPWATGKPVYCHHLCPHGAAQELLFRIVPGRVHVHKTLRHILRYVPVALVIAALAIIGFGGPVSLSSLEAFDAWVFAVAGAATITIAVVGLIASAFIPQAYCKYGCPTGLILNYTRTPRHEHKLTRNDFTAAALVIAAYLIAWM